MKHFGLQACIMCCLDRRLVAYEPLVDNYDMLSLECPDCKGVVRLVYRRGYAGGPEDALAVDRGAG